MSTTSIHAVASLVLLLATAPGQQQVSDPGSSRPPRRAAGTEAPAAPAVPFVFVENGGRWPAASRFVAAGRAVVAHFETKAIALQLLRGRGPEDLRADVVRLELVGANRTVSVEGRGRHPARFHAFTGPDARGTALGAYRELRYRSVWPGVDLRVRDATGVLEYDVLLAPGADLDRVVIECAGAKATRIEADGRLAIETEGGVLRQSLPVAWTETTEGVRRPVACRFRELGGHRYGFTAPGADPRERLVIDPGIEWATFVGGSSYDYFWRLQRGRRGAFTMVGYTASRNFPTTAGSHAAILTGGVDAVVTRIAPDGKTLEWSTFLGGGRDDWALGLALSANDDVTVTGFTVSSDFPTTLGALQTRNLGGSGEAFVTRLDSTGSKLVYSTFLGARGWDYASGVAVDDAGNATVIGVTKSTDFPVTTGAYDTTHNGGGDGFVARLDPAGQRLLYCTYLGSSGWDPLNDVIVDKAGNAFVVGDIFGVNNQSNFPTTPGAYDRTYNDTSDRSDTIVCKLSPDGSKLLWSTWLGGNSWDPPYSIVLDRDGNLVICGESWSTDFPVTSGALQKTNKGLGDAYVTRLSADGSRVLLSTLLGGSAGEDRAHTVRIDPFGALVISGWTYSSDFPRTPGALPRAYLSKADAFVARLSGDLGKLWYSTLVNGTNNDFAYSMDLALDGAAVITGEAWGTDFPVTAGAFDTSNAGSGDAYVARLDMLPAGARRYGASSPACTPITLIGIMGEPRANSTDFGLFGAGAPPRSTGMLLVGVVPVAAGIPFLGARLLIDPGAPSILLPVTADAAGATALPIPLGAVRGARVQVQFLWRNTTGCPGSGPLSSSDALDLTVQ